MTNLEKFEHNVSIIRDKLTCHEHGCLDCALYDDYKGCAQIAKECALELVEMFSRESSNRVYFGKEEYHG